MSQQQPKLHVIPVPVSSSNKLYGLSIKPADPQKPITIIYTSPNNTEERVTTTDFFTTILVKAGQSSINIMSDPASEVIIDEPIDYETILHPVKPKNNKDPPDVIEEKVVVSDETIAAKKKLPLTTSLYVPRLGVTIAGIFISVALRNIITFLWPSPH